MIGMLRHVEELTDRDVLRKFSTIMVLHWILLTSLHGVTSHTNRMNKRNTRWIPRISQICSCDDVLSVLQGCVSSHFSSFCLMHSDVLDVQLVQMYLTTVLY